MAARPVVRRNGTVWIGDRRIGVVWKAFHSPGWDAADVNGRACFWDGHRTRRDAVAALVRADEGTTDADPR